jgi:hypothetical protein
MFRKGPSMSVLDSLRKGFRFFLMSVGISSPQKKPTPKPTPKIDASQ